MKYPTMFFLLTAGAMTSCETAKNAGVRFNWTFDQKEPAATQSASPPSPSPVISPTPKQQVAKTKLLPEPEPTPAQPAAAQSQPTPAQVAEKNEPHVAATPAVSSRESEIPFARPVPGKPGYVYSPFDSKGGYIDVTGYSAGSLAKDPYTGKVFRVP